MVAVLPLLAFSLLVAAFVASRRRISPTTSSPSGGVPDITPQKVLGLARIGHIGSADRPEAVRATMRVASTDAVAGALEIFAADGTELAAVPTHRVVMARGWSRGHLLLSYGEMRREYNMAWPLGANLAGWEIHLVDAAGNTYRCYGAPNTSLTAEIERLHARLQSLVLAEAS
jgi:hypothetical protein